LQLNLLNDRAPTGSRTPIRPSQTKLIDVEFSAPAVILKWMMKFSQLEMKKKNINTYRIPQ